MPKVIETVKEAIAIIDEYQGEPQNFQLPISLKLLEPVGINMAIITDRILEKGWLPNGYKERDEIRIFKYKSLWFGY